MESLVCDNATLFNPNLTLAEKCLHLTAACAEDQETINFFEIYLCRLNGKTALFLTLAVIAIILIFKFICAVVDEYIAPAIVYLSERLRLSEALAGVTLLAFANGAGDVITAIVASDSKEGVSYNVGALYGAGLFVLTLVVALTIKMSPRKITVHKSTIYRDIGFYILATLLTLAIAYTGEITWVSSLSMLFLYLGLVVVVIIQDMNKQKTTSIVLTDAEVEEELKPINDSEEGYRKQRRFTEIFDQLPSKDIDKLKNVFNRIFNHVKNKAKTRGRYYKALSQVVGVVDFPFEWIRKTTIPPVEVEEYDHNLTIAWPILGPLFMVWAATMNPTINWLFLIPVGIIMIIFFASNKPKSKEELPSYFLLLILFGIINGILWTKLLCSVLVDMLTFIGVLTNLSTTYLGLTIIAIGNALPDGLTTIAIAKQGQAMMGITGGVAGQLFGLLVGFGVSMFKKTTTEGHPSPFELYDMSKLNENILDLIVIFFAFGTLVFIFIYGIYNRLRFDNRMANILITIYILFLLISTVIAVYQAFG